MSEYRTDHPPWPGSLRRRRREPRDHRRWGGLLIIVIACVAGEAAESFVPASHLLVPLAVGFLGAIGGLVTGQVPSYVNRGSQAVLGVMIGASLSPAALRQVAEAAVPVTIVTASTVVLSLAAATLLAVVARLDRPTAVLGMIAGGSAAAVACAEDLRADARVVAAMQYPRVALIAATAPVLAGLLLAPAVPSGRSPAAHSPAWQLVTGPNQVAGLVLVAVVAFAGTAAAGRLRLPSAALLGPMVLAVTLTMTGTTTGFVPSGALRSALLTVIGLDVGLRFTRSAFSRLGRLLPLALACSVAVSLACGVLAWLLSTMAHIPLGDAYLATTPGGINAVVATAAASHADISLISSVQSLRLFCVVLLAPLLIRLAAGPSRPDEHRYG